jgi:hypothetical protein
MIKNLKFLKKSKMAAKKQLSLSFELYLTKTTKNFRLNILEYRFLPIAYGLEFQCDRTLQPIGQQFFGVANQKVHFPSIDRLSHQRRYSNVVVLSLDDHLRADQRMPGAGHELSNENVLDRRLAGTDAVGQICWKIKRLLSFWYRKIAYFLQVFQEFHDFRWAMK